MAATKDAKSPVMVTAMPRRARMTHSEGEASEAHPARKPTPIPIRRNWRPTTQKRDE